MRYDDNDYNENKNIENEMNTETNDTESAKPTDTDSPSEQQSFTVPHESANASRENPHPVYPGERNTAGISVELQQSDSASQYETSQKVQRSCDICGDCLRRFPHHLDNLNRRTDKRQKRRERQH